MRKEEVDARMCSALAELPEQMGLEAVEKFAATNLDSVRSKTGFMMVRTCCLSIVAPFNTRAAVTRVCIVPGVRE
jgi:hypothetical protein